MEELYGSSVMQAIPWKPIKIDLSSQQEVDSR